MASLTIKIPESRLRGFNNDVHAGCHVRSLLSAAGMPVSGTLGPLFLESGTLTQSVVTEMNEDTFEEEKFYAYSWNPA